MRGQALGIMICARKLGMANLQLCQMAQVSGETDMLNSGAVQ